MSRAFTRKTVPFGEETTPPKTAKRWREYADQMFVRELNFGTGAIGCALWDASIILSRFILANPHIFHNKTVHEVGAGVGLPAMYASFFAKRSISSDYLPSLVDNFTYNIQANACGLLTDYYTQQLQQQQPETPPPSSLNDIAISSSSLVISPFYSTMPIWDVIKTNTARKQQYLNDLDNDTVHADLSIYEPDDVLQVWDATRSQSTTIESPSVISTDLPVSLTLRHANVPNQFQENSTLFSDIDRTSNASSTSPSSSPQCYLPPVDYFQWNRSDSLALLESHRIQCHLNSMRSAQSLLLDWFDFPSLPAEVRQDLACDVILGSEVSYPTILDTLPCLVEIISTTLSSRGVFYLVQSANRGTSLYFIEELCAKHDFLLDMRLVRDNELTDFRSGQRDETYIYYTFRRKASPFPVMGDSSALPLSETQALARKQGFHLRQEQYQYWQSLQQSQSEPLRGSQASGNISDDNESLLHLHSYSSQAVSPPLGLSAQALQNINTAPYFGSIVCLQSKTAQ